MCFSMIVLICLWEKDVFFGRVKTNVSHEYFMRNKRKYLLINQAFVYFATLTE